VIGDLTTNHSGVAHGVVPQRVRPPDPEEPFYYFHDEAHTYETWLDAATLPKFDWNSAELRRRFIEGPDSVVARWLAPRTGSTGGASTSPI
jgi:alpha-glucosidase